MGVALLAASGRLNRRQATATWWLEHALRQRFPAVSWDVQQPMIAAGTVMTAAGANGHWALLGRMLADWLASEVVRDVELAMLLARAGVAHPVFRPVELLAQADPRLQRLIAFAQALPAIAVSSRTLSRLIGRTTGIGAAEWLRLIKLRQLGNALLASAAPVKIICAQLGFADAASLMRSCKRVTGMTTSEYRQQYGRPFNATNCPFNLAVGNAGSKH
jgi:transcriptional regulator GlxA family with amidase domain